jgi:hypothetical protein
LNFLPFLWVGRIASPVSRCRCDRPAPRAGPHPDRRAGRGVRLVERLRAEAEDGCPHHIVADLAAESTIPVVKFVVVGTVPLVAYLPSDRAGRQFLMAAAFTLAVLFAVRAADAAVSYAVGVYLADILGRPAAAAGTLTTPSS